MKRLIQCSLNEHCRSWGPLRYEIEVWVTLMMFGTIEDNCGRLKDLCLEMILVTFALGALDSVFLAACEDVF